MPLINTPIIFCGGQGRLRQLLFGDSDLDGDVDIVDLFRFRAAFGTNLGDATYLPILDKDDDGKIDLFELFLFRANFGRTV